MMKIRNFTDKEIMLLNSYMEKYGSLYKDVERREIYRIIEEGELTETTISVLEQIYSFFGIISGKQNVYQGFCDKIEEIFSLDRNVVEVAGGHLPTLSSLIDERQMNMGSGTVTMYDPSLIMTNYGHIKLYRKRFTLDTPTDQFDLLVSYKSCEVLELLEAVLYQTNLDFIIGLCNCFPMVWWEEMTMEEYWNYCISPFREIAQKRGQELIVTALPNDYSELKEYGFPIICNEGIKKRSLKKNNS